MAVAMFQPVTRGEISDMFGREISRDLIAALREEGLIAAGPRSPKLGAPYAYVTTEKFLLEFGFESLRDLPDIEALKDAGLMPAEGQPGEGDGDPERESTLDGLPWPEASRDRVRIAAQPCQGWGRGFESLRPLQMSSRKSVRYEKAAAKRPSSYLAWCPHGVHRGKRGYPSHLQVSCGVIENRVPTIYIPICRKIFWRRLWALLRTC